MSRLRSSLYSKRVWSIICSSVLITGIATVVAQRQPDNNTAIEAILPSEAVVYFRIDGSDLHQAAWKKTAAYDAYSGSGLDAVVQKITEFAQQAIPNSEFSVLSQLFTGIQKHGLTGTLTLPDEDTPIPHITLVFSNSGNLAPALSQFLKTQLEKEGTQAELVTIEMREVLQFVIPDSPGIQAGIWNEGGQLVLVAGLDPVKKTIDVVNRKTPNILQNRLFSKEKTKDDYEQIGQFWIDFSLLRKKFANKSLPPLPIEKELKVNDILRLLELDRIGPLVSTWGYKGKAQWAETNLFFPGRTSRLLSTSRFQLMSLRELPPLPADTNAFYASKYDLAVTYDFVKSMARQIQFWMGNNDAIDFEKIIAQLKSKLGFDLQKDLLDTFGDTFCFYSAPSEGFLGLGFGLAVSLKEADKLKQTCQIFADQLEAGQHHIPMQLELSEKMGRTLISTQFDAEGTPIRLGTIGIDQDWLVIGLLPQTATSFFLRQDKKLPRWQPNEEHKEAFAQLPRNFASVSVMDVRQSVQGIMNLVNFVVPFAESALKKAGVLPGGSKFPVQAGDFPPAELVAAPLFPNVMISTVDSKGIHWTMRSSVNGVLLPGGGNSSMASVGASATLVALLLPAVQQAREAARRTQSRNNLRQLGLAEHNYHDVFRNFTPATVPNSDLKTEERLSFYITLLPYLDQAPLYNRFQQKEKWNSTINDPLSKTKMEALLNASHPQSTVNGYPASHYVGITGVGNDPSKRPGIFASNDEGLEIRSVTDGTSNTIMLMDVKTKLGPWAQGGIGTARPLTQKPYINGKDGIGSYHKGGCNALFTDGSVRFLSENIDPTVLENMIQRNDGNAIPRF